VTGAAEEVDVIPAQARTGLLLAAVADAGGDLLVLPSPTVTRTGTSVLSTSVSSSDSMLANSNSSIPYSFRWLSRISLRVNVSFVLNVS
jgi:hypothetical protein